MSDKHILGFCLKQIEYYTHKDPKPGLVDEYVKLYWERYAELLRLQGPKG